jgi:hypothetical protein
MISPRFLPALCVIVGVAMLPTLIHSYAGTIIRDERSTQSIQPGIAGYVSTPTGRDATWGQRKFVSDDWFERRYVSGRDELILTVVRSYDLKSLYHHPELAIADDAGFLRQETRRFAVNESIPVYVVYSDVDRGSVGMYVLHYDDSFVDSPIRLQLQTAGELLFSGRKPMTLFFARALNVPRNVDVESLGAARVLLEAVDQFTR